MICAKRAFKKPEDYLRGFSYGVYLIHSKEELNKFKDDANTYKYLKMVEEYLLSIIMEDAVYIERPAVNSYSEFS